MIKNKGFIIFFAAITLSFCLAKNAIAMEGTTVDKYPDYAIEYTGIDKWENFNRKMFFLCIKANKYIILPLSKVWASIMPAKGMEKIDNVYTNIKYPVRLVGCLCQKDFESSKTETQRFLVNSTWGILGINDKALTELKIKPRNEDIEQALAYHDVKAGPYAVIPLIGYGNVRDIAGSLLDTPLDPTEYFMGPLATVSSNVSKINKYTRMQPLYKISELYPDPYQVSKQLSGMDRYIKNNNLDRKDYEEENDNLIKVQNINSNLSADIQLNNYNSQGSLVDAMRTILFDNQPTGESKWSDLSAWNKTFVKQIKTNYVKIDPTLPKYKFRYIMQKDKNAPLAVIYPSIGEGVMSAESVIQAKMLYDEGYSVVIQGSAFQWEFVKSMPKIYKPGLPNQDAYYLRITTAEIINKLQSKYECQFSKKILVGTSFGGLTGIFAAAQEEHDKALGNRTIGFSNYIFICPPIQCFYALQQIDKYSQAWKNNPTDIKLRMAQASQKVMEATQKAAAQESTEQDKETVKLPLSQDDAEIAIGYVLKQKLSDVVFTIEQAPTIKKSNIYDTINNMSYYDYAQKYLIKPQNKTIDKLDYESSLYSISDYLRNNKQYKIYHSLDDCFVNQTQLAWLKHQTGHKSIFFSNGSHLGFLYRKEFLNEFKKDTKLN